MSIDVAALVEAARSARAQAHAPYSGFAVGAAIVDADGRVVTGANFENASYGLSLCAETVAITAANAAGLLAGAEAIAVVGGKAGEADCTVATPCGRCRQMLHEAERIAGRSIAIYCAPVSGQGMDGVVAYSLAELLPHAFGPDSI